MHRVYCVSPQGSNNNTDSKASPFATIQKAHDLVRPGDTIYLRGGHYSLPKDRVTLLQKNGTENNPIRLFTYQGEVPILDASQ